MATTKQDILNFGNSTANFLSNVGKVITETKNRQTDEVIINKYQQAKDSGQLFFNKDGSPRNPFEISADYSKLVNIASMTGNKSLAEGLMNDYKMSLNQIGNREQNKLYMDIIGKINPELAQAFDGANLDYTKIPPSLVKPKVDPMAGKMAWKFDSKVALGQEKYGQDPNKWYTNTYRRNKSDGESELIEFTETTKPNEKFTFGKNVTTSISVESRSSRNDPYSFKDKDGNVINLQYSDKGGYTDPNTGKRVDVTGLTPINKGAAEEKQQNQEPLYQQGKKEWESVINTLPNEQKSVIEAYLSGDESVRDKWEAIDINVRQSAIRAWEKINNKDSRSVEF